MLFSSKRKRYWTSKSIVNWEKNIFLYFVEIWIRSSSFEPFDMMNMIYGWLNLNYRIRNALCFVISMTLGTSGWLLASYCYKFLRSLKYVTPGLVLFEKRTYCCLSCYHYPSWYLLCVCIFLSVNVSSVVIDWFEGSVLQTLLVLPCEPSLVSITYEDLLMTANTKLFF